MNEIFLNKQQKNPKYSLRAYAKYLELNPGTLSAILAGKRTLPSAAVDLVAKKLGLNGTDLALFKDSTLTQKLNSEPSKRLCENTMRTLFEEWEYFVILGVMRLKDFDGSLEWIANKAEISLERTVKCVSDLKSWQLVEMNDEGILERSHVRLYSHHDIPSDAIRSAHVSSLEMAGRKIHSVPVDQRDYSFATMALDEKGFKTIKKKILKLRNELNEFSETCSEEKLYRFSVQFFSSDKIVS